MCSYRRGGKFFGASIYKHSAATRLSDSRTRELLDRLSHQRHKLQISSSVVSNEVMNLTSEVSSFQT